jgi:hypothetical protein
LGRAIFSGMDDMLDFLVCLRLVVSVVWPDE